MTKPPLDKGNFLFGHSIKFNNDALSLVKNLQQKHGDIFEISILHKRVTLFMTPSATKHIYLDTEDNFSSKHGWEFSLGKTFENGLMLRDFDDHRFHRGLLQDSFRRDALANYLQIVQPLLDSWIDDLQNSKSFNLYATIKELMFKISLELFFDEIDSSRQKELEKLFTDAIKSATSVVRIPLPFTKLRKGLKARKSLLEYFENKAENVNTKSNTLFAELVKTNKEDSLLRALVDEEDKYNTLEMEGERFTTVLFPPAKGELSSGFDYENKHYGVDIAMPENSPVHSISDGIVVFAEWTSETGFVIITEHLNGLTSIYQHNSSIVKSQGDRIQTGEIIAFTGNTGSLTTGPHLHFELWYQGEPVDPENYIEF